MKKKILIVCICLVTVCAVLGLNDKLSYTEIDIDENGNEYTKTGLEIALDMVENQGISEFKGDLSLFKIMALMIEERGVDITQTIRYYERTREDENGNTINEYVIVYTRLPPEDSSIDFRAYTYVFNKEAPARRFAGILSALEQYPSDVDDESWWSNVASAVNLVVYYIQVVFVAIMGFFEIIIDTFKIIWNVLESAFYLLGF